MERLAHLVNTVGADQDGHDDDDEPDDSSEHKSEYNQQVARPFSLADSYQPMSRDFAAKTREEIMRAHIDSVTGSTNEFSFEKEKLEKAALECPVHHSIHPDISLEVDFVWGL